MIAFNRHYVVDMDIKKINTCVINKKNEFLVIYYCVITRIVMSDKIHFLREKRIPSFYIFINTIKKNHNFISNYL